MPRVLPPVIPPSPLAQQTLLQAAVEAEAQALLLVTTTLARLIIEFWKAMLSPYDKGEVDKFVHEAGRVVTTARKHAAGISDAYMKHVLDVLEIPTHGTPEPIPDLPRGIPLTTEFVRPVKVFRRARLEGLDELRAHERAMARAEQQVAMDVALAARDARMSRLVLADTVTGWRRIVHPEVIIREDGTPSPVCGLCLVAADRVYDQIEKQALHDRCRCTILPVTDSQDPGSPLNNKALRQIYKNAGGTDRQSLAKQRYKVEYHSELGPVLVNATYNFRGAGDVRIAAPELVALAKDELAALEDRLKELLARELDGEEDLAGPIQWDTDRIAALRELTGAA